MKLMDSRLRMAERKYHFTQSNDQNVDVYLFIYYKLPLEDVVKATGINGFKRRFCSFTEHRSNSGYWPW